MLKFLNCDYSYKSLDERTTKQQIVTLFTTNQFFGIGEYLLLLGLLSTLTRKRQQYIKKPNIEYK